MIQTKKKIESLQALRALAAISVMLYHGTAILKKKLGYIFASYIFCNCFYGIELFFVISGFIIFYSTYSKDISVKDFLIKRIARIYPIHTLIILGLVLFYFIYPSKDESYRGEFSVISSSLTLIPYARMVLGPSWTLCYEMMFYLFFAIAYLINNKFFFILIAFWSILILVSIILKFHTGITLIDNFYNPINLNFIFGCLIGLLFVKVPSIKNPDFLIVLGILLTIVFSYFLISGKFNTSYGFRVFYYGIPSCLLVVGSLYSKIKTPRFLIFMGNSSFSLYLIHFPLIRILVKLFSRFKIFNHLSYIIATLSIFTITIILSSLFYKFIELKLTESINRYLRLRIDKKVLKTELSPQFEINYTE